MILRLPYQLRGCRSDEPFELLNFSFQEVTMTERGRAFMPMFISPMAFQTACDIGLGGLDAPLAMLLASRLLACGAPDDCGL